MPQARRLFSRRIGRFRWDRAALAALIGLAIGVGAHGWLLNHPQHNPWAPLDLRDPPGWATGAKLLALRGDTALCREVLTRSEVEFEVLPPDGDGPCARPDRTRLTAFPLAPDTPATTCSAAVAMYLWERDVVQPAAQHQLSAQVIRIQHLGAYSCRRLYGRDEGPWSEHASANAIDIAGFVLADGTTISVLRDWESDTPQAQFLRLVRDGSCDHFATVLSPNYNDAHADHFHFDMSDRWTSLCR
ncbi:extensin family protein [Altererythrobacter sp. MF3-039]|uniref:extensin-like domain-containing protein n=1 Tax=Altererythrobacter sp. MF3-039 TaxID=3252901 RepID=UPI00390C91EA